MSGLVGSIALGSIAGKAGRAVKAIPPRAWLWIALAAALFVGFLIHQHKVKALAEERYATGFKTGYAAAREDTRQAQAEREKIGDIIARKIKEQNDETVLAINRLGDSLRVRGPGKASAHCAPVSPGASGYKPASGSGDVAVDRLSDQERIDLIALPFGELIDKAEQCDMNLAEVNAWREWHSSITKSWRNSEQDAR